LITDLVQRDLGGGGSVGGCATGNGDGLVNENQDDGPVFARRHRRRPGTVATAEMCCAEHPVSRRRESAGCRSRETVPSTCRAVNISTKVSKVIAKKPPTPLASRSVEIVADSPASRVSTPHPGPPDRRLSHFCKLLPGAHGGCPTRLPNRFPVSGAAPAHAGAQR
jgi:hypothetical protein